MGEPSSARARQAGGYTPPVLAEPTGGPIPKPRAVAAAGSDDDAQRAWQAAVAAFLAGWPVLSVPLVNALVAQVAEAGAADLARLSVPQNVVDGLAAAAEQAMVDVALDAAVAEVAAAQAQGVTVDPPTPDGSQLAGIAAVTATLIGVAYVASATRRALQVGPGAAADVVRELLTELGTASSGVVVDHVRVAMGAAQHAGRRAVFEAHPPAGFVADESGDHAHRCAACADVDGRRYPTLAAALADYPGNGGYRSCAGGLRCRGRLLAVWA